MCYDRSNIMDNEKKMTKGKTCFAQTLVPFGLLFPIFYHLCQAAFNYIHWETHQCALHSCERITRTYFLMLQPSIRPVPAQVILLWNGRQNFALNVTLYPCERSRQNHLDWLLVHYAITVPKVV